MHLSVIIPAYNEEQRLPATLKQIRDYLNAQKIDYEIIVIDDGSQDRTLKFAQKFANNRIKVHSYSQNHGKGFAVKTGIEMAKKELILFMDADNSTPITELPKLASKMPNFDLAIGSRYVDGSLIEVKQPFYRVAIGRIGNLLIKSLVLRKINDTQCGFKLFKAEIAKELFSNLKTYRFGFDIEILARASKKRLKIAEVPVLWLHTAQSRVRPIRDAFHTFLDLLRIWWIVK